MSDDKVRQTDVYQRVLAACTCAPSVNREQHALVIAREVLRLTDPAGTLRPQ